MNAQRESRIVMARNGAYMSVPGYLASFVQGVNIDKRTLEVKVKSTIVTEVIANTLQNSTIVRKQVETDRCTGSQVKCAAIDRINREKVQHVVCSSEPV